MESKTPGPLTHLLVLAAFVAAGLVVYYPSLKGAPVLDDLHTIVSNPGIRSVDLKTIFTEPSAFSAKPGNWPYRPVVVLDYALDWKLGGGKLWIFHLGNLILHCLTAFLIYLVCLAWTRNPRAGMAAGFLFLVHPLPGFSACYISARSGILCGLFLLLSFLFLIRPDGQNKSARIILPLVFFLLALLSKIDALSFVFVALCLTVFSNNQPKQKIFAGLTFVIAGAAFAVFYKIISGSLTGAIQSSMITYYPRGRSILAGLASPWIYGFKLVWPVHLTIFPAMPEPAWLVLAISCVGYLIVILWAIRHRTAKSWTPLVWYFGALLPAAFMQLNILFSYHRAYVALVGLFIGVGLLADRLFQKPGKFAPALIALAALLLAGVSHYQSRAWQDPQKIWTLAVERAPNEFAPHHYLGTLFLEKGDLAGAEKELDLAIALRPDFTDAHNSLAAVYYKKGELRRAESEFEAVYQSDPENFIYLKNLVTTKIKLRDMDGLEPLVNKLKVKAAPDDGSVSVLFLNFEELKNSRAPGNPSPRQ
jgi:protein O-mannosyl-transferase